MAQLVAEECAKGEIGVDIQIEDESKFGYAPDLRMNLDTRKLRNLGWRAKVDLKTAFFYMMRYMKR